MSNDWEVVVEAMPREEAERALCDWLNVQSKRGTSYSDDDVRRDLVLSRDRRQLVRYAIRRKKS